MCLHIDASYKLLSFDENDQIVVYKVVYKHDGCLWSAYRHEYIPPKGTYASKRTDTNISEEERLLGEVNYGIHVFLNIYEAEEILLFTQGTYALIRCVARKKDFVAKGMFANKKSAVFTEVEILGEIQCA